MADNFSFRISENAYQGDAQFVIKLDGKIYSDILTSHANHETGEYEDFSFTGDFSAAHQISVTFLNDVYVSFAEDRNLFVDRFGFNGLVINGDSPSYTDGEVGGGRTGLFTTGQTAAFNVNGFLGTKPAHVSDVFRFFDTHDGGHFFTTSTFERDQVLAQRSDLKSEGIGFQAFDDSSITGTAAVFRFFDTHDGGHFFTANTHERDQVLNTRPDLKFEGISYYEFASSQGANSDAVYRFFDTHDGGHFFTSSTEERDQVLASRSDLKFEGIAFYAPHHGVDFFV